MRRLQQQRQALGSAVCLTLVLSEAEKSQPIFNVLWQQIDRFEQCFSRFRADSELSTFNATAGDKQAVSPEFRALLMAAKTFAEKTGGLYNPCILPALQQAGYKGSWPRPDKLGEAPDYETRAIADWHHITINDTWAQIPNDTALDFGGIGKGYLLDQLGDTLLTQGVSSYWLSLGGDILCNGYDAADDPWYIGIADAKNEQKSIAAVKNHGQKLAIATSGVTKRQGISEKGKWHHLIDPRTGKPAKTDMLTATVCSTAATAADVAAKCLVITGRASAKQTLTKLRETDALLQITDGAGIAVLKLGAIWE
jgi:thiamine biosynthesis lipoprotein